MGSQAAPGRRAGLPRRVLFWLLVAVLAQAAAIAIYREVGRRRATRLPRVAAQPLATAPAPALLLERADGSLAPIAPAGDGPMLVHFWATWCPPCREELPRLLETARRLSRERPMRVVAISLDRGWEEVDRFFRGRIPGEVLRDPGGSAARAYGVANLPDTYLVDGSGNVRARFAGAQDWDRVTLIGELQRHTR